MFSGVAVPLVWAVLLVVAAGAFAAADAAIGTASRARVDELVREGRGGARQLALVLAERPRHVNLLLLLRLACELSATVMVTIAVLGTAVSSGWAVLSAIVTMLLVSYVLVGVGPRTIGRQHPYRVGLLAAAPVRVLARVLNPLTRLLILVGNTITPGRGFREGPFSSEVELRELVDLAGERGVVAAGEREMIHSVFELGDTTAREVMVPRTEIVWIEHTKSVRQALALSLRSGFSRVPVIGESVDDIVGVVTLKDLAGVMVERGNLHEDGPVVADLMRPASFVPDSKRLDELLQEMQLSRSHMAVAVDEYGGTAGLLTIEDIIEEIVGEITDESDREEYRPVERLEGGVVRVSSRLPVEDFAALFEVDLDDSEVETVGGLLAQRLGRVPLPGAEAEIAGLRLRAEGGKDHRGRIRINALLVRGANEENAPLGGADQEGYVSRG
ncbi:CBS domain containing-hemolysin-like protein [Halopolyspora algeriensis]|uniref:CBS domain containing-hemolysin-like protein n=1 Tax=Halopolyspora algeriensis TaxID=1500506 RepID=A0A368VJ88_9ACTN|nr:hemolysin family protein [Halopolyspora algeriensis]RCW40795.1 CBS domain containing-hemolysin-like protein [Halopolyspora algeriensis]TQM53287.1 CBS domain containing-hemolysin-like protein [Halopolyspora algeriensis]